MKGRPVLYGLFALASIGSATAVAQFRLDLAQRLDSIASAGVRESCQVSEPSIRGQGSSSPSR